MFYIVGTDVCSSTKSYAPNLKNWSICKCTNKYLFSMTHIQSTIQTTESRSMKIGGNCRKQLCTFD